MSMSERGIWIGEDGQWTDRLPRCNSCWFCGSEIKIDVPCYMPVRYVEGKWVVRGEFCNLSCLVSHILHHIPSPILHLKMFYKLYGKNNLEGISVYPLHHYLPRYTSMTSPIVDDGSVYHVQGEGSNIVPSKDFVLYSTTMGDNDRWNKISRFRCWYDTEECEGIPYPRPCVWNVSTSTWDLEGTYCSLECVKRELVQNIQNNSGIFTLFQQMCRSLYGVDNIRPARDKLTLSKFNVSSGISIQTYRSAFLRPRLSVSSPDIKLHHRTVNIYRRKNNFNQRIPAAHQFKSLGSKNTMSE